MLEDGFKLVTTKKRKTKAQSKNQETNINSRDEESSSSKETALRRIQEASEEIASSDFFSSLLETFNRGISQLDNLDLKQIICYGLGHITGDIAARYQLGLLLSLKDRFSTEALVYDPIFYKSEIDILQELGCEVLLENEEGKREISTAFTTLVYLPHCPKQLTNNFLWANWGPQLKNCIILSNSFSKIIESHPKRILNTSALHILEIHPFTTELVVSNSFRYTDIFNDSALHIFPKHKFSSVPDTFWDLSEEPDYSSGGTEFITKKFSISLSPDETEHNA